MANDPTNISGYTGTEKAQLDVDTLSTSNTPAPSKDDKVELDLDDAPFLMEEEDEELDEVVAPVPTDSFSGKAETEDDSDAAHAKKRKLMFGGIGLLVLALFATGWWVLKPAPTPPKPVKRIIKKQTKGSTVNNTAKEDSFEVAWEPFWVEQRDEKGQIRFLVCKFAVYTEDEKLSWEAKSKKVTLRDAIFYYLRNKTLKDLSDKENVQVLKSDLLTVINQYMGHGQFKDVFIENYLVK